MSTTTTKPDKRKGPQAKTWFQLINRASEPAAELGIFDEIGRWGVSHQQLASALGSIPSDRPVKCLINSPGGDVWQALAIYDLFNRRGNVSTHVVSLAASAASIVALAGSNRVMSPNAMLMIHLPTGGVQGESSDVRKYADMMDKVTAQMAKLYSDNSDMSEKEAMVAMEETTYYTAEEALEEGLIDEIDTDQYDGDAGAGDDEDEEVAAMRNRLTAQFDLRKLIKASAEAGRRTPSAQPTQAAQTTKPSMNKIIAALVALGFACPADATEDQIVNTLNNNVGPLKTERDNLKSENGKHLEARKARVTAKVKAAIEAKKIKPEREASLVALGTAEESNLDFLDDLTAASTAAPGASQQTNVRAGRVEGAPPVPRDPNSDGNGDTKSNEDKLNDLKLKLRAERDPVKINALVKEMRALRGEEQNPKPKIELTAVKHG
jgi:ATP-dependent Clp endopeptidase proteolytic subunit ClpP